jgi:hypothetical protein
MATPGKKRTAEWRKQLTAQGYKQKALMLSPQALKDLAAVKHRFEQSTDADAVALALRQLAVAPSNAPKRRR